MRFSLYTEMQLHGGKTPEQLYAEVLEQIENADRLGYDCYASIEHFFFPKFSVSAHPTALFAAAAQRTKSINFRTMLHVLPYHNPMVLASEIAVTDILTGGRYEWGVGRGHGWIPEKAGAALDEHARPKYEEAVDLLFTALGNERFSFSGEYYEVADSHVVPFPKRSFRIFLGGTSDRTYELAAEHGWGVAVPPLLP
jgi:alkanesulfonate monooxygenase SsuD/methylene tetrahydromethanopterin reductase-like flavin-dependent oxidoreductase (luciferase family)